MENYDMNPTIKGEFEIKETETDLVVATLVNERKAAKLCEKLNSGTGFNGWTPTFFTTKLARTKAA